MAIEYCRYCDRNATWRVRVRLLATQPPSLDLQTVCDAHEAVMAALNTTTIVARQRLRPADTEAPSRVEFVEANDLATAAATRVRSRRVLGRRR